MNPRITGFLPLPVNNFKYFLTLFSKFFSSFPHGTCSLSVSCQYLALDEMYHPFWTAFPNNPTLWAAFVLLPKHGPDGNVTLYVVPFQETLATSGCKRRPFQIQFGHPYGYQILN